MKKIVAIALLSAVVSTPAFAEHTSSKFPAAKSATTSTSAQMHDHKTPAKEHDCDVMHGKMEKQGAATAKKDECDVAHGTGSKHQYGKMYGQHAEMLMEPDMRVLGALALNEEQQAKITKLADELKHNNWATQGLINDESSKLRELYQADKLDPAAIGKEYQKVFDFKRKMIETYLDTQNRIEEILTPEQRAHMKEARSKNRRPIQ